MIRFFKSPQPAALFTIPVIIVVLWGQIFLNCKPVAVESSMPLWNLLSSFFSAFPSWLNFIFMLALISGTAIYLNVVLNKHEVLYKNSYLPSFVYALYISSIPAFLCFHPIHFVNILVIRIFDKVFGLFKNERPVAPIFDFAFLAGTVCLLYFPATVIIPLLLISMLIIRPWNFREWMIMFVGIALPFFFVLVWMFWIKDLPGFVKSYIEVFKSIRPEWTITTGKALITLASLLGFWLFASLLKLRMNYLKNIVRTRSNQQIVFLMLLFFSGAIFLTGKISLTSFALLAIPFSTFGAYYLVSAKKRIQFYEIFLWMVVAAVVWCRLQIS